MGKDDDYRVLSRRPGFLVRRLHQIHLALFIEECGAFGVTPVQYSLMTVLDSRPDIEQTALANEVGIDRATTTNVLARLERKKLIKRHAGTVDKRAKLVRLTGTGTALLRRMGRAIQRTHDRTIDALSKVERAVFLRYLARLVQANNHTGRAALRLPD